MYYARQIWFTKKKKIIKEILSLYSPRKSVNFFHNEMSTIKSILWGKPTKTVIIQGSTIFLYLLIKNSITPLID